MKTISKKGKLLLVLLLTVALLATGLGFGIPACVRRKRENELKALFQQHYDNRVALFIEENRTANDVDIVFLGDSLTEGYDVQAFYPHYNVLNRGIGGDTTFGLEKRLQVSAYDVQPKVVVMLIGANNFSTMLNNYERILQSFQSNLPNSKIVLLSLTAMSQEWGKNNDIAIANNQRIHTLAVQYGYTFVDMYTPLCDPTTNELYADCTIDGGHLNKKGYTIVTNTLSPVLDAMLSA